MKAARFHGPRDIRVEDVPVPDVLPGTVLVAVEWCGICGSDLHEYVAGPFVVPPKERPHAITGEHAPVTMGHEFCGRVSRLPDDYAGPMTLGQPIMVDPRIVCRSCERCTGVSTNFCKHLGFVGLSGRGGGLSEAVAVSVDMCYPLPEGVDMRLVALIEPLAVARHAVRASGATEFTKLSVLILGGGPIGQGVVLDLKAQGVGQVIVSEPTELRRKQIGKLADKVIDSKTEDVPARCQELTKGRGVDMVFDCAGAAPAVAAGFGALAVRGTYVNVAGWETAFTVPMGLWMMKEITLKASLAYEDQDFAEVVKNFSEEKYSGLDAMVTARIRLDDVVKGGFEQLIDNKDNHVKILVTPKPELIR